MIYNRIGFIYLLSCKISLRLNYIGRVQARIYVIWFRSISNKLNLGNTSAIIVEFNFSIWFNCFKKYRFVLFNLISYHEWSFTFFRLVIHHMTAI